MKKKTTYDIILFSILGVLAFLPILQEHFRLMSLKPLNGVVVEEEKPECSKASYVSGRYQKQMEAYLGQHFGFREPVIRIYNQYLWNFYRKTYARDVAVGKKEWLYYQQSVSDYYGHELLRWHPDVESAKRDFDQEVKYLNWARTILYENGVELMVFMAPEKAFLYPEFLPNDVRDTTTFNACDYFADRLDESGFPYIEMTRWFQKMKDTVDYPLIPQVGAHWIFTSVYAVDSLSRLMGELKGVALPKIKIGEAYEVRQQDHDYDNDLEQLLNLAFALRHQYGYCPRSEVGVEQDSTLVKPKVLFVGNSFFWSMAHFVPMKELFDEVEFWYYFSTIYDGDDLQPRMSVAEADVLEKLLHFDYVVWFTTGNQMNKGTSGFANALVLNLCVSKKRIDETREYLTDSLALAALAQGDDTTGERQSFWNKANDLIHNHPDRYFVELASDSMPSFRNPRIREIMIINEIKRDSVWMANLSGCQTVIQNTTLEQVLLMEAHNVIEGRPLMRDMPNPEQKRDLFLSLVEDMQNQIILKPDLMRQIEEKAKKNGKPVEKQLEADARWIINDKIKRGVIQL